MLLRYRGGFVSAGRNLVINKVYELNLNSDKEMYVIDEKGRELLLFKKELKRFEVIK